MQYYLNAVMAEQIYRWAATSDEEVLRKRPEDAFIKQIKKVSKEIKLRL